MLKLVTTLEINTGLTKRSGRSGGMFSRDPKNVLLRISGTPDQLASFLSMAQNLPDGVGLKASFDRGEHYTGVMIHSKVAFPVTPEFTAEASATARQLDRL